MRNERINKILECFNVIDAEMIRKELRQKHITHPIRILAAIMMNAACGTFTPVNGEAINRAMQRIGSSAPVLADDVYAIVDKYGNLLSDFVINGNGCVVTANMPEADKVRFARIDRFLEMVVDFDRYGKCAKWEKRPTLGV